MEAATVVGAMTPGAQPDHDLLAFVGEVSADLPAGETLGLAEARVDYLLQKISEERLRIDRIKGAAAARIDMISDHAIEETRKIERRIAYAESLVRQHAPGDAAHYKKLYGKKSLSLPHGTVGWKQHPATVEIVDKEKALAFAKLNNVPVKVEESVGLTALKEWFASTGQMIDPEWSGITIKPATDEFFCKPALEFI